MPPAVPCSSLTLSPCSHPDREVCQKCFSAGDPSDSQLVRLPDPRVAATAVTSNPWMSHSPASKRVTHLPLPLPLSASQGDMVDEGESAVLRSVAAAASIVHEGIECDMCRMCPIVGPRYKSKK